MSKHDTNETSFTLGRLPRDVQIRILSLCDMDVRRMCGIRPGKLRVPPPLQRELHDILVKQLVYICRWRAAWKYYLSGHYNIFLMHFCNLTHHEIDQTKPW